MPHQFGLTHLVLWNPVTIHGEIPLELSKKLGFKDIELRVSKFLFLPLELLNSQLQQVTILMLNVEKLLNLLKITT